MLAQRIYGLCLGWADVCDHNALRNDLVMQTAVGRDQALASAPTLSRLETAATTEQAWALHGVLVQQFIASHAKAPKELVLDVDATHVPLHGEQERGHFHAYYDNYCYLPLYVFAGQDSPDDEAASIGALTRPEIKHFRKRHLTASNRKSFGDEVVEFDNGTLDAKGKRVVVIGGGDTAMDCVRTAIRQGAVSVKCLYRRDKANMPGSQREVQNAEEEGVDFVWLTAPRGFVGSDHVQGVIVQKMRLGAPDASGRQSPEIIEGADYTEAADLVIQALGFEPEDLTGQWDAPDLAVTRWGTVKADFRSHATNLPGVYAAGDIVRGASLVVWAIRDGREAADAILEYLAQPAQVAAE